MPGSKRRIDEDTWLVSQSKRFKQGILLSSVYETTLAHLRLGVRQFFMRSANQTEEAMNTDMSNDGAVQTNISNSSPPQGTASPYNTPPSSPSIRDIISENELQNAAATLILRPEVICQECVFRTRNPLGNEDNFGKCAYCDKLVCHLNLCRGCSSEFCRECCIAKYDDSSSDAYECYHCLH